MFKRKDKETTQSQEDASSEVIVSESQSPSFQIVLLGENSDAEDEDNAMPSLREQFSQVSSEYSVRSAAYAEIDDCCPAAHAFVVIHPTSLELDQIFDAVIKERSSRGNGFPIAVVVIEPKQFTMFGQWLMARAASDSLAGLRVVVSAHVSTALGDIVDKFKAITEPSVLSMPSAPEVEDSPKNYFFAISDQTQKTVRAIRELAENGIERIYLLGGPGSGKTTLAYYYWLTRNRGRFIAVNLNAESSGDKDAMKSLLCGHVSGAFPGASSREGAFSYCDGGVTFLDESHGVTGIVMQVLMEALDSGQYLPFGATKKRLLDCAVIFASNRSWEQLREQIDLDEHARLGATIVPVHDLYIRQEDLIIGVAIAFARFSAKCTTWNAPLGCTEPAWQMIRSCPWSGNMRTLFRVMETALTSFGMSHEESELLDTWEIQEGINLWEPVEHHSQSKYTSYR